MDPLWAQVIFTGILVFITALYAKFTSDVVGEPEKTRENMWKLSFIFPEIFFDLNVLTELE